jgi:hypothetical protein
MKSFQEFVKILNEKIGDFGSPEKYVKPKENCYGRTVKYGSAPKKKVCSINTDTGSGGSAGDSGD